MLIIIVFHCPEGLCLFLTWLLTLGVTHTPKVISHVIYSLSAVVMDRIQTQKHASSCLIGNTPLSPLFALTNHAHTHSRLVNFSPFFTSTMLLGNQDVINVTFAHTDARTKKQKPSFNAPGEPLGCVFDATNIKVTGVAFVCQC